MSTSDVRLPIDAQSASRGRKFTERGHVRIWVAAEPSNGRPLYIEVEDTGCGISAQHLHHIFEPFRQTDSSINRTHGGTGLGLAISSSICRELGYGLTVKSAIGHGSTFRVQLS